MPRAVVRFLALVALFMLPSPAHATIIYDIYTGFYPPEFYDQDGGLYPPYTVSYGPASCPAAGTPNYLCARGRATAGINGSRIYLGTDAYMKRTDAQTLQEHGVYGSARVLITPVGGYTIGPVPGAYFVFGLSGSISRSVNNANVAVSSYVQATLSAGSGGGLVCVGVNDCPLQSRQTIKVTNWDPANGFQLELRSDVKMMNPQALTGWDGEGGAEFYDTFELLAIRLVDENDQPIPGVTLTMTDGNGQTIVIPDTPPDPDATTTPTPLPTATPVVPTPTVTTTPACANPPCEDCENCIDDDGDGFTDRADDGCPAPANGGGVGLGDPASAKALDKCAKAFRKVGAKLTTTTLGALRACLKGVGDCIQLKPGDVACLTKAQAACTKARTGLTAAHTKLSAALVKPCGEPAVAAAALGLATGLGFDGETTTCARRGVASLATVGEIADCVRRQHACGAERLIGFAVPRAAELLTFGGWDVASDLPCLEIASVGGGAGVAADKRKALRKCDLTVQKATAKLVSARTKATQACAAAVFTCQQTKPGDGECLTKASGKCAQASAPLPGAQGGFAEAIAKACGAVPLAIGDLLAPEGLGLSALAGDCAALDVASLATLDDVATCLARHLACRVDQSLASEVPRIEELLEAITK